jgi:hypothetical protein
MRVFIGFIVFATSLANATAFGQAAESEPPEDIITRYDVIDSPPAPQPNTGEVRARGVILDQPGQVLLSGKPVNIHFQSPTNGISFQLRAGGTYSSISGVSYGVGFGYGGIGWGGYGFGYGGVAPYYGEVVTRAYQPICEAPCDATLLSGRHRLALSLNGNKPIEIREPVDLTADAVVEGRYVDKSRMRKAGWAVFAAGAVAGMAMMFASINYRYDPNNPGDQIRYRPMFYSGVGLFLGSIITGSVLASQDDEAYANVYPKK